MRQAGRYLPEYRALREKASSFLDLCFTPELATEVTLQPIRRFGFDAAILFSDILVVPHALGRTVTFEAGEGPRLEPLDDAAKLNGLSSDADGAVFAPVYEAVRRVKRELPPNVALLGFCGAPWTVATYMIAGQGLHSFDEKSIPLRAGSTIRIPAGVKHNLSNTGNETIVCLISFSSGQRETVFLE